jgi:anti-anti-sigma factor
MYVKTTSIDLHGELDISSRDTLREILRPAGSADEAILDFSDVTFIDASALGCLVAVVNRMVENNRLGIVRVVGASRQVLSVFHHCRLDMVFDLSGSAETVCEPFAWTPARRGTAIASRLTDAVERSKPAPAHGMAAAD